MPRKSRKPRKHEDPECKARNENKPSKDTPSSRQDESNSEVCSSYSSEADKNEEPSSASKTHEKAVYDTQSHFSEISEGSKSSDEGISSGLQNEASSASIMEVPKENDNEGNLKTTDATSTDDSLLIQGNKNITRQPETSDTSSLDFPPADRALKNEIVCEKLCATAKASHSELSDATKIQMDSTIESNASIKEDVICGPKQLAAGTSRSARTVHQEKSSDEEALWTGSADEDVNKVKEIKVDIKDEIDSTFQEDLNSRSVFSSHPRNQDSKEPGQQMCSSLGAVNTDSQLKHSTKKGRGKTGVPFKHTSEAAIHEHNRKRPKSTSAVSSKTDMQKNKRENLKQRTKSEPTSKIKSKLLSKKKSGKGINSPGTSFRAQESVNRDNDETGISHLEMSAAAMSGTCDLEEQSKISLNVSLRKRKSTEYVPSGSSKKVSEEIPSKRIQRESSRESKTSPRGKSTSPRSPRKRQNKSGKSNSDSSPPKPLRTVTTSTESMTEYVGDAAFIAVGESPPKKSTTGSTSSASHAEEPTTSKYKVVVYASDDRTVTTQTQSVKEYLIFPEDSLSHGSPVQPMMEISSTDITTIGTDNLHTESTLDRNLNVSEELSETERSPTVSSSESVESDTNVKQSSSMTYRGARPKTRGKNTKEISPQKRYMAEHTGDILTVQFPETSKEADSLLEVLPKEAVKETDSLRKQSSSTIHMGARPKTCIKTRIFPKSEGDRIRSGLSPANDQGQSSNVLLPSFEEFKETLGVDKVEVVDINFDVFDRALGIDRSSGDSEAEHRHDFKIISPKRLSEAMSHDNGESSGNKTAAKGPESSEMVEQDCLPTIEEFRRTLRTDQNPPLCEDASEILNKALEEMESKRQNLQSKKVVRFLIPKKEVPSTSKGKKSPERQIDSATSQNAGSSKPFTNRGPVPGILAFSGYRKRENPIGLAVPDCFDLKAIANALDEILRSELENTAEEISNAPLRPDVIEDSEESIEDINRAIAKSGMKLKRSQVISSSSDDEFTAARESVEVTLHSSTRVVSYEIHRDISETSRSSTASSEECNTNSSKYLEDSSESIVQSPESDEK